LKKAMDDCMVDVEALVKEIEEIEVEIDRINKDTEGKIKREPGTPTPAPAAKPDENKSEVEAKAETPDTKTTPTAEVPEKSPEPDTPDIKTAPAAEVPEPSPVTTSEI
jgi:heme-binding NEAT domain protein